MNDKTLSIIIKAQDQASKTLEKIGNNASDAASKIGDTAILAAKRLALVGGAAIAAGAAVGVKMNASLETATLQFETLMGSAAQAEKHVQSLFKFAKATPFETGPIIEASRMLHTFGGDALNTERTLKLVGDAAAATSQQINEVGFWTGRAYNMIKSGKPFGEAAMRLQEMGVLSSEARTKMENLQESGAAASEVYAVFEQDLSRFNGAMLKQSTTLSGLTSTLKDVIAMDLGYVFEPLFETTKKAVGAIVGLSESPAWGAIKENARNSVGFVAHELNKLIDAFESGGLSGAMNSIKKSIEGIDLGGAFNKAIADLNVKGLYDKLLGGIASIDWTKHAQSLSMGFVAMIAAIDWMKTTAAMVPVLVKAIDGVMIGTVLGVINWARTDPLHFAATIVGFLFMPAKFLGAITSSLAKLGLVGQITAFFVKAIAFVPQALGAPIRTFLGGVGNAMKLTVLNGLLKLGDDLVAIFFSGLTRLRTVIDEFFVGAHTSIGNGLSVIRTFFSTTWDNIVGAMSGAWNTIRTVISDGINSVIVYMQNFASNIGIAIGQVARFFTDLVTVHLPGVFTRFVGLFSELWTGISGWIGLIINIIRNLVPTAFRMVDDVAGAISQLPARIAGVVSNLWGAARSGFSSFASNALGWAKGIVDDIVASFARLPGLIKDKITGAGGAAKSAVGSFLDGIKSGFTGRATGGPVSAGRPYIVGEREPELFVPNQSGQILNQKQMAAAGIGGAGGGVTINGNIMLGDASAVDRFFQKLDRRQQLTQMGLSA